MQIITIITFFWKACSQKKGKKNKEITEMIEQMKKLKRKDVLSAESWLSLIPGGAPEGMNGTPDLFH